MKYRHRKRELRYKLCGDKCEPFEEEGRFVSNNATRRKEIKFNEKIEKSYREPEFLNNTEINHLLNNMKIDKYKRDMKKERLKLMKSYDLVLNEELENIYIKDY
jgi:hypothetical protein